MDIFDGVELSEEQKATLKINYDQSIADNFKTNDEFDSVLKNKDQLLGEKKAEQEKRRVADADLEKERHDKALKSNDIESLKTSYEERISKLTDQVNDRDKRDNRQVVSKIASSFVNEIFVDDVFVRESATAEIAKRLRHENGETVVLSADGSLSSLSVEDLFTEVRGNSKYASHIIASEASGGGAGGGKQQSIDSVKGLAEKGLGSVAMGDKAKRTELIQAQLNARK
jgi:hypothetical protein